MEQQLAADEKKWLLWHTPWRLADKGWLETVLPNVTEDSVALTNMTHQAAGHGFSVMPAPLISSDAFSHWVLLEESKRSLAFNMLVAIIDHQRPELQLDAATRQWCGRFAKALHCDKWTFERKLSTDELALCFLKAWFSTLEWQRIRLCLPREAVLSVEAKEGLSVLLSRRIDTLWRAIFCYLAERKTA